MDQYYALSKTNEEKYKNKEPWQTPLEVFLAKDKPFHEAFEAWKAKSPDKWWGMEEWSTHDDGGKAAIKDARERYAKLITQAVGQGKVLPPEVMRSIRYGDDVIRDTYWNLKNAVTVSDQPLHGDWRWGLDKEALKTRMALLFGGRKHNVATDGTMLLIGKKPAEELLSPIISKLNLQGKELKEANSYKFPDINQLWPDMAQTKVLKVIGTSQVPDEYNGRILVYLSEGSYIVAVDANKLALLRHYFPNAQMRSANPESIIAFTEKGEKVGALMPFMVQKGELPPAVMEAVKNVSVEQTAWVPGRKEVARVRRETERVARQPKFMVAGGPPTHLMPTLSRLHKAMQRNHERWEAMSVEERRNDKTSEPVRAVSRKLSEEAGGLVPEAVLPDGFHVGFPATFHQGDYSSRHHYKGQPKHVEEKLYAIEVLPSVNAPVELWGKVIPIDQTTEVLDQYGLELRGEWLTKKDSNSVSDACTRHFISGPTKAAAAFAAWLGNYKVVSKAAPRLAKTKMVKESPEQLRFNYEAAITFEKGRNPSAKGRDESRENVVVVPRGKVTGRKLESWKRRPGRFDIKGVDTPKNRKPRLSR